MSKLSLNEDDQISLNEAISNFHARRKEILGILGNVPNLETIYNRLTLLHMKEFQPMCDELICSFKRVMLKLEAINNSSVTRSQELTPYNDSEFVMS